jgi:hypothetical protein
VKRLLATVTFALAILGFGTSLAYAQRVPGELSLEAEDGTYLGCVTCGDWHVYSISNPSGLYGSTNGAFSVWNANGLYGRISSPYSMCNGNFYNQYYIVDDRGRVFDALHISDGALTDLGVNLLIDICSFQERFSQ